VLIMHSHICQHTQVMAQRTMNSCEGLTLYHGMCKSRGSRNESPIRYTRSMTSAASRTPPDARTMERIRRSDATNLKSPATVIASTHTEQASTHTSNTHRHTRSNPASYTSTRIRVRLVPNQLVRRERHSLGTKRVRVDNEPCPSANQSRSHLPLNMHDQHMH